MKLFLHCTIVGLAALVLAGCNSGTATAPNTSGGTDAGKVRKLTVTSPGDQTVHADRTDEMTISISRSHFNGPVDIDLRNLPATVSIVTKDLTIPADKSSMKVTVKADPTAKAIEKHKVMVAAKAKDEKELPEATVEFMLNVKSK